MYIEHSSKKNIERVRFFACECELKMLFRKNIGLV